MAQHAQNGEQVYLIDASVYIFRAWFSIPDSMRTPAGAPVNAVYGFLQFLLDVLEKQTPAAVGVAFDESLTSSFRNQIYPAYKANRESAPEDLKTQFRYCRALCKTMGLTETADAAYEADDIIGSWAAQAHRDGKSVVIVSRDKDLCQLIQPGDWMWDFASNHWMDSRGIQEKFGIEAEQIADYLALTGDSVDNIPGIKGIGPKAAVALLNAFGNLEGIYNNLSQVPELEIRGAKSLTAKLAAGQDDAQLSRKLTGIVTDIPELEPVQPVSPVNHEQQAALFEELGFSQRLLDRVHQVTHQ